MQKGFRIFSIIISAILAVYFIWAGADRQRPPMDIRLQLVDIQESDTFSGKGNVLGISPWMYPTDYASKTHLLNKLDGYMQVAKARNWLHASTIVVFPEHIGTWLMLEGEKGGVYRSGSVQKALSIFVTSNFFSYLREWFTAPDVVGSRTKHSIFSSKSAAMARDYQDVFSTLARKYGVTIVAGSILLSNPSVEKSRLRISLGALSNVTGIFHPDGKLDSVLTYRSRSGIDEKEFVPDMDRFIPHIYQTAGGRMAVLTGLDAYYPEGYAAPVDTGADIVAVPYFSYPDGYLRQPWAGLPGGETDASKDSGSVSQMTNLEAIYRYGMPSRIRATKARLGMMVPLRGQLWDIGSDGQIIAVRDSATQSIQAPKGASILNVNLR